MSFASPRLPEPFEFATYSLSDYIEIEKKQIRNLIESMPIESVTKFENLSDADILKEFSRSFLSGVIVEHDRSGDIREDSPIRKIKVCFRTQGNSPLLRFFASAHSTIRPFVEIEFKEHPPYQAYDTIAYLVVPLQIDVESAKSELNAKTKAFIAWVEQLNLSLVELQKTLVMQIRNSLNVKKSAIISNREFWDGLQKAS